jgi:hypothetical protein
VLEPQQYAQQQQHFQMQMQHPQFLSWQHGPSGMSVVLPQQFGEPGRCRVNVTPVVL